ncbi:VOC family protein [Alkalibacterium sp. 20]|uniref:VOC family protein n=1 Tax=Alkalibacterium sp. 20 TaxID=1798803 RepID=UPI0009003EBD|nr:VOC family protein [Alkalibacterium sp. 20]OJF97152.1 glyoxalase [Alkalibacterium sp. 20]
MIKGIHHKGFQVTDMEKTLHFYCEVLGFEHAFDLKDSDGYPWIEYVKIADGSFVEFFYGGTEEEKKQNDHICFEVEAIEALADKLRDKGISFASELSTGKDNNKQFWIKDPDGNWLEFMELDPDSPQMRS